MNVRVCGNGEPLMLIHGVVSDGSFFDPISKILAEKYSVIYYDRRGYGIDDKDWNGEYDVKAQADDAAAILKEYAKEPAWILGNSAGGIVAIELAMRYPELVRGLFLLEPSLGLDEESKKMLSDWNAELNGYVSENRIKKALPAFGKIIGGNKWDSASTSLEGMKQTYKNLHNFMYGELNEVQKYEPGKENLLKILCPIVIIITEDGRESIFAKSSLSAADVLGWKVEYIPGYHNAFRDLPESAAERLDYMISTCK